MNTIAFFIIADLHTLTTRTEKEHIDALRQNVHDCVARLSGVWDRPCQSTISFSRPCHAVYEMNLFFEMLVTLPRLARLPDQRHGQGRQHG